MLAANQDYATIRFLNHCTSLKDKYKLIKLMEVGSQTHRSTFVWVFLHLSRALRVQDIPVLPRGLVLLSLESSSVVRRTW